VVCEEEPSRPSTAATDPALRRQLRGDLDTILLHALAKAPERRYRGAGNLADDLQRHLDDRPVRARPDSFGYRAGKFLRRNKAGGAAAALILLTLLAGVVATTRQAQIANRERARAERRFKEVRKIANSLMFEFHDSIADLPGALPARQLVTQRALEYLDSLAQEAGDDLSLRSELALAYDKIGRLTFDERQAVAAHEKAAALNQGLVQAAPANAAYRMQLSQSYDALSDTMKIAGRSGPAIEYARKSLNIVESLPGSHPEELAAAHVAVGVVLSDAGDFQGARQEAQTARELEEKLQTQDPSDLEHRWALESSNVLLSQTEADAGDFIAAVAHAREAVAIARDIFAADPANTRHRRDMWATQFRLGRQLAASGDARAALENYQPALTFLEALAAADPKDTGHRRWLAVTYSAVGDAHARLGEPQAARGFQEKARALSEDLLRADPERLEAERDLIQIKESLGTLTLAQGETTQARDYFADARARAEKLAQRDPANARVQSALAHAYAGLATSGLGRGQNADAENLRQQSRQIWSHLKTRGMLTAADAVASEIELAGSTR
ncbi:MAG: tetratricopeptide repeat protein, partial [Chthoniobacterales bacterium]